MRRVFSAHAALPFYAMAFEKEGKREISRRLRRTTGRISTTCPGTGTVTLVREAWECPGEYEFGGDVVVPFMAGQEIPRRVVEA